MMKGRDIHVKDVREKGCTNEAGCVIENNYYVSACLNV